jgi:hypothetical protein
LGPEDRFLTRVCDGDDVDRLAFSDGTGAVEELSSLPGRDNVDGPVEECIVIDIYVVI